MMKITGLSHLFKLENLHNWWLTKYFFAPLYIYNFLYIFFKYTCIYYTTFTFSHLGNAFIQSDLQMRTIEAIKTNKTATTYKFRLA